MTQPPKHLPPFALPMPLRDMVRGMGSIAAATEERLEPAMSLLPAPMRELLARARETMEAAGHRATDLNIGQEGIHAAAEFLRREASGQASALVGVLADCWQRAAERSGRHLLFSETVAATALAGPAAALGLSGYQRAAAMLSALSQAHVAGHVPGSPVSLSPEARDWASRLFLACFVWLLTERPGSAEEEPRLFELAVTLVESVAPEVADSLADPDRCAALLARLSEQL